MSWTSSILTKAWFEACTRSETDFAIATAGAESRARDRNVFRTAISTLLSFHGTTWLLRRMTRIVLWAADSRLPEILRDRFSRRLLATMYALLSTSVFSI